MNERGEHGGGGCSTTTHSTNYTYNLDLKTIRFRFIEAQAGNRCVAASERTYNRRVRWARVLRSATIIRWKTNTTHTPKNVVANIDKRLLTLSVTLGDNDLHGSAH